jgi:signal transduction histidine kinase
VASGRQRSEVLLAGACLVFQLLSPRVGSPDNVAEGWPAGVALIVLAVGQGVPVMWRTRRPMLVAAVVFACYAAAVAIAGLIVPLAAWVMLWTLAATAPDRRRLANLALATALPLTLLAGAALHPAADNGLGPLLALTVIIGLAAALVRTERGRLSAARGLSAASERLRIAGDVHDLVGHGLSTVAVQSSAARLSLDAGDLVAARTAIGAVETTSRAAMREVRQWLEVLRDGTGTAPVPQLSDVFGLVDNVRAAGMVVDASVVTAPDLPASVQLSAYRVVQEALTNAVKHAPGALVFVDVSRSADGLVVVVTTTGGSRSERGDGGGTGIDGLRARVAAVGGSFTAGPEADGWRVEATLPLQHKEIL